MGEKGLVFGGASRLAYYAATMGRRWPTMNERYNITSFTGILVEALDYVLAAVSWEAHFSTYVWYDTTLIVGVITM